MIKRIFILLSIFLLSCGNDDSNNPSGIGAEMPSSSIIDENLSSNMDTSSSNKKSSSSDKMKASSSSTKSADTKSSQEKRSSSSKEQKSSSSDEQTIVSSSNNEKKSSSSLNSSDSDVDISSDSERNSSSEEKLSFSETTSSSNTGFSSSEESSSSKKSSSSSIKESSSSVMESSSSSIKVAEIKPNNYYKVNCPEGIVCKYVITDFLNQEFLASDKYGEILDERDGLVYKTIEIGSQTWLAQNMNYDTIGVCYENVSENCEKYGKLYLKNVASKICPTGWKLPDSSEWRMLINYTKEYLNKKDAGTALKSSNGAWFSYTPEDKYCVYGQDENCISGEGTNELGFSAIPLGDKANIGENGYTTFGKEFSARAKQGSVSITYDNYFGLGITYYNYLHAIRCIRK